MRFVLEKLVNNLLIRYSLEDVRCQIDDCLQVIVEEVTLKSQLQLSNILSCNTFIIEFEELLTNDQRIDLLELDREYQLTVAVELLQHFGIAVLEAVEENFYLLKDVFFWLRRVDPLSQLVEQLLFVRLAVLLSSQVPVHRRHAIGVSLGETILERAAVQIQIEQIGQVRQFPRQGDDESVLQINLLYQSVNNTYPELATVRDFDRYLSERVVVQPQLLQVLKVLDLRAQLNNVVVAQVQADQVCQFEHL